MSKKISHLRNQTWIKEASPDDPIYTRGFVYLANQRKPKSTGMSPEDIEQFGREAQAGFQAQADGEDPTAAALAVREQADEDDQ